MEIPPSDPKTLPQKLTLRDLFVAIIHYGLIILRRPNSVYEEYIDNLPQCLVGLDYNLANWEIDLLSESNGLRCKIESPPNSDFTEWLIINTNNNIHVNCLRRDQWIPTGELIEKLPIIANCLHRTLGSPKRYSHRNKKMLDSLVTIFWHLKIILNDETVPVDIFMVILSRVLSLEKWDAVGISVIQW